MAPCGELKESKVELMAEWGREEGNSDETEEPQCLLLQRRQVFP